MPDRYGVPFVLRVNGRCGELRALVDDLAEALTAQGLDHADDIEGATDELLRQINELADELAVVAEGVDKGEGLRTDYDPAGDSWGDDDE